MKILKVYTKTIKDSRQQSKRFSKLCGTSMTNIIIPIINKDIQKNNNQHKQLNKSKINKYLKIPKVQTKIPKSFRQ